MNIAPHHFRDTALIHAAQRRGLMLIEAAIDNKKSNVGSHFRGYWWG